MVLLSKREQCQCNHCQHANWEYGCNVLYGWYLCKLGRDTKFNGECGVFEPFKGILIRKQWLK